VAYIGWNRNNTNKDCPCKHCVEPKRHVGCRSTCPEWKPWRDEMDRKRDESKAKSVSMDTMSTAKKKALWKKQRYGKQKKTWYRFDDR
jgi:hypothetical protein